MNNKQKNLRIFCLLYVFFIAAFHSDLKAQNIKTYYTFASDTKYVWDLNVDASGNFYFIDYDENWHQRISKVSSNGIVSTVLSDKNILPRHLALDNAGNVFFSDENKQPAEIKKVNPDGTVSSFASGNLYPEEMTFNPQGQMYFTDRYDYPNKLKKVNPDGTVSTILATPDSYPQFLDFDKSGTLYFTDQYYWPTKLKKMAPEGSISDFVTGYFRPQKLTIDTAGNLFFIDTYPWPYEIKKITPDGTVSVLAKLEISIELNSLTLDQSGNLYFIARSDGQIMIITIQNPSAPCATLPPPNARDTAICSGRTVSLSANGFGELQWYDAPAGGNLLNTGNNFTTSALTTNTTFYIQSYFCNSSTARTALNVTVYPPPTIVITGSATGIDSVVLTASGGVSYLWSGGNSTTTAQNTFKSSGSYSVTVTNAGGCVDIANTLVTVNFLGLNKYGSISVESANKINYHGAIGESMQVDRYGAIRERSNGLTAASAAASAYEIKQNFPASTDGYYWIKNPNINGGTPFKIYADMTTDGGGWTLIMCNASNAGWNYANAILLNPTSPSINSNYSIIGWADYIKRSASGFQYMIDANVRRSFGGIWTANGTYTFLKGDNTQTNITLNTKFGTWAYHDAGIEERMPWYSNCSGYITTSVLCGGGSWWGTLISNPGWTPAPWISSGCGTEGCMQNPGIIWYWVR